MSAERERLRLGFDDLAALAGFRPGARLVEVGCGTGQATVPLAERGFAVTGVEIGPRLAAFTRHKLAGFPNVEIVNAAFEEWNPGDIHVDGIVVVNAFHWIDPGQRYAHAARLLRKAGALAIVSAHYVLPDDTDPFWGAVQTDYAAVRGGPAPDPPLHPDAVGDWRADIEASGHFRHVAVRRYRWQVRQSADDYVALLSTSSWHRQVDPTERRMLFARIHQRVDALPNRTLTMHLLATLDVARRN